MKISVTAIDVWSGFDLDAFQMRIIRFIFVLVPRGMVGHPNPVVCKFKGFTITTK
jgi:hypothetical protein